VSLSRALAATLAVLAPIGWAPAQAPPPGADALGLDPGFVIDRVRDAYAAGPLGDAMLIQVTRGTKAARERAELYVDARAGRLLLVLGDLRVYAGEGRGAAVHDRDDEQCVIVPWDGVIRPGMFDTILPPLVLPQLAWLAPRLDSASRDLAPFAGDVEWVGSTIDESVRPPTVRLQGRSRAGDATLALVVDASNDRPREFTITVDRAPDAPTVVSIRFRAADPGDPSRWAPFLEGRERVPAVSALRASTGVVCVGGRAPNLSLFDGAARQWTLEDEVASRRRARGLAPGQEGPDVPACCVVLARAPAEAAVLRTSLESAAVGALAATAAWPECPVVVALVFSPDAFDRAAFDGIRDAWAAAWRAACSGDPALAPAEGGSPPDLLWSSSGSATFGRVAPDAQAVILVVGWDARVRAVEEFAGSIGGAGALRDRFAGADRPSAHPPAHDPGGD